LKKLSEGKNNLDAKFINSASSKDDGDVYSASGLYDV
jgi:hypothetical protein